MPQNLGCIVYLLVIVGIIKCNSIGNKKFQILSKNIFEFAILNK